MDYFLEHIILDHGMSLCGTFSAMQGSTRTGDEKKKNDFSIGLDRSELKARIRISRLQDEWNFFFFFGLELHAVLGVCSGPVGLSVRGSWRITRRTRRKERVYLDDPTLL